MPTTCSRCAKSDPRPFEKLCFPEVPAGQSWEGTPNDAVCPGCQLAELHPHCTSVVDISDRERVDFSVMPREEIDFNRLVYCEHIDLTRCYLLHGDDWPDEWTCPECGGTEFDLVRADYQASGLQPGTLSGEIELPDDD